MTGSRIKRGRLELELARRGLLAGELADAAGVSPATVTAAIQGKAISHRTLQRIALALSRASVIPGVDELLDPEPGAGCSFIAVGPHDAEHRVVGVGG
jgi:transcriptional regulator with XRE-family HTH domain